MTPTPWMLENHADKGKEPWQIYAWCVHDAMAKQGKLQKVEEYASLRDMVKIEDLMQGLKNSVEIKGRVYEYNGKHPV